MAAEDFIRIAVAVVRRGNDVLAGPRPEGRPLAGYWEFPGGKIRPGEGGPEAALRECLEETALAIRIVRTAELVEHDYAHGRVRIAFFDAVPEDPSGVPLAPFRWIALGELHRYRFPEVNRPVLARLIEEAAGAAPPFHRGRGE